MTSSAVGAKAAFEKWDSNVIGIYSRPASNRTAIEIVLDGGHARTLVLVVADLAVRRSDDLGRALAELDHARLRDAAVQLAIGRYLELARPSSSTRDNRLIERILAGLVQRGNKASRPEFVRVTIAMPVKLLGELDEELQRVLTTVDTTHLHDWPGDLATDLRSSLVEAITAEWMHQRAVAFGSVVGRDRVRG